MKIKIIQYGYAPPAKIILNDLRCVKCGKLLARYSLTKGIVSVKCNNRKCKHINEFIFN